MVASKRVHCAFCRKKCTGNVLRYQDQYYHKQCFELEQQSESAAALPGELLDDERMQVERRRELSAAAGRTTGESAPADPASLYIESAASANSPTTATTTSGSMRNEPTRDDGHENLYRYGQQAATATQSNQTRVFTSHASNSQLRNAGQSAANNANSDDNSSSSTSTANGSLASHSRGSSSQNISSIAKSAAQRHQQPAANMMMSGGRFTSSSQMNQAALADRSSTLPHSISSPSNGFSAQSAAVTGKNKSRTLDAGQRQATPNGQQMSATCAGCRERISDGQALIALDLSWHVWCFKCTQCKAPLHGEYVAKDGKAYCERDYQKLFGITCVYCKRYITGKVLQAGEAHHFHPSCARCSKCGDPFVPGEEMYLQGEVTWHPRCGPNPNQGPVESSLLDSDNRSQLRARSPSLSSRSRSRSASPFSYMSRQYGRASPAYADSEAVGDLSRIYTISYLTADPNQGYLRRPIEPHPPKSPQFSRPTSMSRLPGGAMSDRSRCSSRSQQNVYGSSGGFGRDRSVPRGMYSVLSGMGRGGSSTRARSPSMMNEEAIQMAAYPSGQKPAPDSVPKIERDDFPAPPFPYPDRHHHHNHHHHHKGQAGGRTAVKRDADSRQVPPQQGYTNGAAIHAEEEPVERAQAQQQQQQQERASRPRSREIAADQLNRSDDSMSSNDLDPQFRKEEEELSKIANGIGKIFLQTLKEREKLRAWKRANLDPRNASRTPSATRELPSRMRYENPTNASPSRDMDRPRPWEEDEVLSVAGDHSPTRTRSSLGRSTAASGAPTLPAATPPSAISSYSYKVVQANRSTPRPGYGLSSGSALNNGLGTPGEFQLSFAEQQRVAQARANDLLGRQGAMSGGYGGGGGATPSSVLHSEFGAAKLPNFTSSGSTRSLASAAHLRRSMPNVANLHHLHQEGPPKLYPYHLLATTNYRLPPEVDRCHLERHLSNEEFQYIFHCDRIDFYRLPEWKRNELKRRARLF